MRHIQREDYNSDEELLEHLIGLYGENIKKLSFTYVKNWSVAEDLTQETFIASYKKLKDFRGESSYKTWLYKIAINKCKDFLRSKWYRIIIPFDLNKEKTNAVMNSIEDNLVGKENDSLLAQSVLALPRIYREVIILHYYEDLKISEIEELTGIKQETVKTRLRRAKEQLRKEIRGENEWKQN